MSYMPSNMENNNTNNNNATPADIGEMNANSAHARSPPVTDPDREPVDRDSSSTGTVIHRPELRGPAQPSDIRYHFPEPGSRLSNRYGIWAGLIAGIPRGRIAAVFSSQPRYPPQPERAARRRPLVHPGRENRENHRIWWSDSDGDSDDEAEPAPDERSEPVPRPDSGQGGRLGRPSLPSSPSRARPYPLSRSGLSFRRRFPLVRRASRGSASPAPEQSPGPSIRRSAAPSLAPSSPGSMTSASGVEPRPASNVPSGWSSQEEPAYYNEMPGSSTERFYNRVESSVDRLPQSPSPSVARASSEPTPDSEPAMRTDEGNPEPATSQDKASPEPAIPADEVNREGVPRPTTPAIPGSPHDSIWYTSSDSDTSATRRESQRQNDILAALLAGHDVPPRDRDPVPNVDPLSSGTGWPTSAARPDGSASHLQPGPAPKCDPPSVWPSTRAFEKSRMPIGQDYEPTLPPWASYAHRDHELASDIPAGPSSASVPSSRQPTSKPSCQESSSHDSGQSVVPVRADSPQPPPADQAGDEPPASGQADAPPVSSRSSEISIIPVDGDSEPGSDNISSWSLCESSWQFAGGRSAARRAPTSRPTPRTVAAKPMVYHNIPTSGWRQTGGRRAARRIAAASVAASAGRFGLLSLLSSGEESEEDSEEPTASPEQDSGEPITQAPHNGEELEVDGSRVVRSVENAGWLPANAAQFTRVMGRGWEIPTIGSTGRRGGQGGRGETLQAGFGNDDGGQLRDRDRARSVASSAQTLTTVMDGWEATISWTRAPRQTSDALREMENDEEADRARERRVGPDGRLLPPTPSTSFFTDDEEETEPAEWDVESEGEWEEGRWEAVRGEWEAGREETAEQATNGPAARVRESQFDVNGNWLGVVPEESDAPPPEPDAAAIQTEEEPVEQWLEAATAAMAENGSDTPGTARDALPGRANGSPNQSADPTDDAEEAAGLDAQQEQDVDQLMLELVRRFQRNDDGLTLAMTLSVPEENERGRRNPDERMVARIYHGVIRAEQEDDSQVLRVRIQAGRMTGPARRDGQGLSRERQLRIAHEDDDLFPGAVLGC